ncbi:Lar family restriction alleviation protein [Aeromonas sp. Y318-3]|uniref:Lar family restriction alleviation protein n=1 Tax=Aeromonas sp. Y318-3 TaxID=2990509 RepID=UPI0022E838E7|nr:Lar family restriction alleviation protein [Aeromonas sp. Y318-3]
MKIHPCPFCGQQEELEIIPIQRQDLALNKHGKVRVCAYVRNAVECGECGARGPISHGGPGGDNKLTPEFEQEARNAAVLFWNARAATSNKAFELVAAIIDSSLAALPGERS